MRNINYQADKRLLEDYLTIKSRAWYLQLLHSQRWWVQGKWSFVTTLQLVCFKTSFGYHLHHQLTFRQNQHNHDFCCQKRPSNNEAFYFQYMPVYCFYVCKQYVCERRQLSERIFASLSYESLTDTFHSHKQKKQSTYCSSSIYNLHIGSSQECFKHRFSSWQAPI